MKPVFVHLTVFFAFQLLFSGKVNCKIVKCCRERESHIVTSLQNSNGAIFAPTQLISDCIWWAHRYLPHFNEQGPVDLVSRFSVKTARMQKDTHWTSFP